LLVIAGLPGAALGLALVSLLVVIGWWPNADHSRPVAGLVQILCGLGVAAVIALIAWAYS
jgi:hypothetical protein